MQQRERCTAKTLAFGKQCETLLWEALVRRSLPLRRPCAA